MADFVQTVRLPFCCQEPSGGGRTHLEEESSRLIIDMERSMFREVLQGEWHASYHRRTEPRNVLALQIVIMPSGLPGHTGKDGAGVYASWDQSPQDALSQEGALSCLLQYPVDLQKLSSITDLFVFPVFHCSSLAPRTCSILSFFTSFFS